ESTLPSLSSLEAPAAHQPATRVTVNTPRVMRAIDYRDGDEISMDQVVEDFAGRIQYLQNNPRPQGNWAPEKFPVARVRVDYDEDRQLHNDRLQPEEYNQRIDALTAGAWKPENWQDDSLVASGGFCAPSQPDYSTLVVAGNHRPVAQYLPTVQVERGSIVVTQ